MTSLASPQTTVTVSHTFEAGHRLHSIPGKCTSLHGHSWRMEVTIGSDTRTVLLPLFGTIKKAIRGWVDLHLDHGLILADDDPLLETLAAAGKVHVMPTLPTVEAVAWMLLDTLTELLGDGDAQVLSVRLSETSTNSAEAIA